MSVQITLSDAELPPSHEFIEFLDAWLSQAGWDGATWASYGLERPQPRRRGAQGSVMATLAERICATDAGAAHLARAYDLFVALLIGDVDTIRAVRERFHFVLVVGLPRSGGKYLTKQLYRALGYDPVDVPAVLAHDGFPDSGPWRFDEAGNSWIDSLQTMAEYLAMVEIFFADGQRRDGRVVIPKKATKAAYAPGLYQSALGTSPHSIVTVRHPVPSCISTYETAGGLPADGRFAVRGNIEGFCARDLTTIGFTGAEIRSMDYFDAYLRYWEEYHLQLATGGAGITRSCRVIAYGPQRYMGEARHLAEQFGAAPSEVEDFHCRDRSAYRSDWMARAEAALERIDERWQRVGLKFPIAEVAEAW